jgi:F0F1-type ATP synthase alpha subunit
LGIELKKPRQQQEKQQLLPSFSIPPIKFKSAFEELVNKHVLLNCGIEKIDSLLKLTLGDRLVIIGNRKYIQTLITRLCVNALLVLPSSKKRIADFFIHLM